MAAQRGFWLILIDKTPTAFRGKSREDLVPTLRQLQRTQTGVTLRWFERGRVWESPAAAIASAKLAATEARERRSKDWRPGGDHRDPRARFALTRDQKRAKFKQRRAQEHAAGESAGPTEPPTTPDTPAAPPPHRPDTGRRPGPGRGGYRKDGQRSGRPPAADRGPFGSQRPEPENPFKKPSSPRDRRPADRNETREPRNRPDDRRRTPGGRTSHKPPKRRS